MHRLSSVGQAPRWLAAALLVVGLLSGGCAGNPHDAVFRSMALDRGWDTVTCNAGDVDSNNQYFMQRALSHTQLFSER